LTHLRRQAIVKLRSARSVVGGQGVFDESGAKVGRVVRISKSADDDGSIDVDMIIDDQAAWDKVASATYAGVQCSRTDTAGCVISLVDRLGDDPTGAPKFERMLKTGGDEGRDAMAQVLKRIHLSGAQRFDPGAVQKARSIFSTRAKPLAKSQRAANMIAWAAIASDVAIGDRPVESIAAIKAAHQRGARTCMF
jgi:hypothetical protein